MYTIQQVFRIASTAVQSEFILTYFRILPAYNSIHLDQNILASQSKIYTGIN